jgi:hypothetical protein
MIGIARVSEWGGCLVIKASKLFLPQASDNVNSFDYPKNSGN